jgi:hypothetical protein
MAGWLAVHGRRLLLHGWLLALPALPIKSHIFTFHFA